MKKIVFYDKINDSSFVNIVKKLLQSPIYAAIPPDALKGKWLELSTPSLVHVYSTTRTDLEVKRSKVCRLGTARRMSV